MKRGWCPTVHEPMQAGDGLLVRVKPPAARLSSTQASQLADLAQRHGNGVIELTSRANLQFRGLQADTVAAFAQGVVELCLAHDAPEAERRRNLIVSPLAGYDPGVVPDTIDVAASLSSLLADEFRWAALAGKFGIVVDGGGHLPTTGAPGDVLIQLGEGPAMVSVAGSDLACATDDPVSVVSRLVAALLRLGGSRMGDMPAGQVFAQAGLLATARVLRRRTARSVGVVGGAFGFGAPFGQLDAIILRSLAAVAANHGDGTLRLTPWRTILAPDLSVAHASAVTGLITCADDQLLSVDACIGAPACARAVTAVRADALWLVRSGVRMPARLHVSGCTKGCANPSSTDVTLVGTGQGYDLIRHGHAASAAVARGQTLAQCAAMLVQE